MDIEDHQMDAYDSDSETRYTLTYGENYRSLEA